MSDDNKDIPVSKVIEPALPVKSIIKTKRKAKHKPKARIIPNIKEEKMPEKTEEKIDRRDTIDPEFEDITEEQAIADLMKSEYESSYDQLKLIPSMKNMYEVKFATRNNIRYYLDRGFRLLRRKEVVNLEVIDRHSETSSGDMDPEAVVKFGSLTGLVASKVRSEALRKIYAMDSDRACEAMDLKTKKYQDNKNPLFFKGGVEEARNYGNNN